MNSLQKLEQLYIFIDQNRNKEDILYFFLENELTKDDLHGTIWAELERTPPGELNSDSLKRLQVAIKFIYSFHRNGYKETPLNLN